MHYAELKVKSKTLAAEAAIIRKEERIARNRARANRKSNADGAANQAIDAEATRHSLYVHRTRVVRVEARATHLARAFLHGKDYKSVENKRLGGIPEPLFNSMARMVNKYGDVDVSTDTLAKWLAID
jgi:hypothetical protein